MIDEKRLAHMLGVAKLMKSHASKLGLNENEMFVLGLLHDVGYEFDGDNHEIAGGTFLKGQGYKYWKEVTNHGKTNCEFSSAASDLLNWCDMHVDSNGKIVTFEERLKDIATRHGGENSLIYQNAAQLVKQLQEKNLLLK